MKIKICGITSSEDAIAAIEAGCDILGFNFYTGSPRYVTPGACTAIRNALEQRNVRCIYLGVFVNCPSRQINAILDFCGLDKAQLAGDEPARQLQELEGRGFKSLRPSDRATALEVAARYAQPHSEPSLLIDAHHPTLYGGSGQTGDWTIARQLATRYPLLLAGGLTPKNVALAVERVRPWGVDVASGVEIAPGKKDPEKMLAFVQAARKLEGLAPVSSTDANQS